MKERFENEGGHAVLIETLLDQRLLGGDKDLIDLVASVGTLIECEPGETIITQGGEETDVFFILAGSFDVHVNGVWMADRKAGTYVGEMAAIEPTQMRSATVTAKLKSVALRITKAQLDEMGVKFPDIWKRMAKELARRLEQRNQHVTTSHDKVRVFVMCSVEAMSIARVLQSAFEYDDFTVTIWDEDVFLASHYPLDNLEAMVDSSDFAVAIAQPDDIVIKREKSGKTPRDNVIFELGFFMGRLGRKRTLLIEPRGEEVQLPTDLSGLIPIVYKHPTNPKDLSSALGPACTKIRNIILDLGPNN